MACTLSSANIVRACTYKDKNGVEHKPKWVDATDGETYYPSANIPPTSHTPVMYLQNQEDQRIIEPMMWGLVPYWHKDSDPKSHGLSTHNARIEGIQSSKLYNKYLEQRCVIVCDGFYEWQRGGSKKQPYFVYAGQKEDHEIDEVLIYSQDPDSKMNEGEWNGPKLLYMAGLYSIWTDPDGVMVHSYTIITRDPGPVLSWLHNRVPCILTSEDMVNKWLDPDLSVDGALRMLKAPKEKDFEWHAVSTEVGNVKNQDLDLIKEAEPIPQDDKKKGSSSNATKNLMSNWLKKSPGTSKTPDQKGKDTIKKDNKEDKKSSKNLMSNWLKKSSSTRVKDEIDKKDNLKAKVEIKEEPGSSKRKSAHIEEFENSENDDNETMKRMKVYKEEIPVLDEDLIQEYQNEIKHEKDEFEDDKKL